MARIKWSLGMKKRPIEELEKELREVDRMTKAREQFFRDTNKPRAVSPSSIVARKSAREVG